MNCKPGDLAVVVESVVGNEGKIGTCLRLATEAEKVINGYAWSSNPMWVMDRKFHSTDGLDDNFMFDSHLRPLRDNPGTDETLTWAPVPSKVAA